VRHLREGDHCSAGTRCDRCDALLEEDRARREHALDLRADQMALRTAFRAGATAQRPLSAAAAPAAAAHGGAFSHEYLPPPTIERNPGQPLDLQWATARKTNAAAIEARGGEIGARRSIKKEAQAAWLLRALTCIDLTTLAGDDTPGNVKRLCAKARNPVRRDIMEKLGVAHLPITCGAVCVYPLRVADAAAALEGSSLGVAAVRDHAGCGCWVSYQRSR
jgi:hypothetical protein